MNFNATNYKEHQKGISAKSFFQKKYFCIFYICKIYFVHRLLIVNQMTSYLSLLK